MTPARGYFGDRRVVDHPHSSSHHVFDVALDFVLVDELVDEPGGLRFGGKIRSACEHLAQLSTRDVPAPCDAVYVEGFDAPQNVRPILKCDLGGSVSELFGRELVGTNSNEVGVDPEFFQHAAEVEPARG